MPFQVIEKISTELNEVKVKAIHKGHPIEAIICGLREGESLIGETIDAELDFDKLVTWNVIPDFDDEESGMWSAKDGLHLKGRVENVTAMVSTYVVDIYIQYGTEHIAIVIGELNQVPKVGSGIEIVVDNFGSIQHTPENNQSRKAIIIWSVFSCHEDWSCFRS